MKRATILLGGALLLASLAPGQELVVFPAVTADEPGLYDSLWVTEARVVKVNPNDWVTVRRKWVCLPEGGFLDDPATAPVWGTDWRVAVMGGTDLLAGTVASAGAVGLEVEGGPVLAHAHVADASRGLTVPGAVYGQGQLIPAFREPLRGPSHIPWLGGCMNTPCALSPPLEWNYLRNNIGIVNPNPEPLTVRGRSFHLPMSGCLSTGSQSYLTRSQRPLRRRSRRLAGCSYPGLPRVITNPLRTHTPPPSASSSASRPSRTCPTTPTRRWCSHRTRTRGCRPSATPCTSPRSRAISRRGRRSRHRGRLVHAVGGRCRVGDPSHRDFLPR